jgi:mRNA interferase RelE/StbE
VTDAEPAAYIRLTDPAVEDLQQLATHNPQALEWALKKMLLLEENPNAGEALLGGLIEWRKPTVGNRDGRIVWRPTTDPDTTPVIEIAEVWAGITPASPPVKEDLPSWLVDQLVHTAGVHRDVIEGMTLKEAVDAWTAWTTSPH